MPIEMLVALVALASALVGGLVSGWYALRGKSADYENDYFKTVLKRRLAAYEAVEDLIGSLKAAILDHDHCPYHLLFSEDESFVYGKLSVMSKGLWLSDDLFAHIRDLNVFFFEHGSGKGVLQFGKTHYKKLALMREEMEKIVARDLVTLHKVPDFLERKRKSVGFSEVNPEGSKAA